MYKKLLILLFLLNVSLIQAQEKQKLNYLFLSYDLIPDNRIQITEDDYINYIAENEDEVKSSLARQQRTLQVSFEVPFLEQDSLLTFNKLKESSNNFANAFSDSSSIYKNRGKTIYINSTNAIFQKPIGEIIHFVKDNLLNVAKIKKTITIADSAKVRHILIRDEKLANQLFEDLKKGNKTWDEINKKHSLDVVSASKGGVIDYFTYGMMVEPFNTFCFSEDTKIGETHKVQTVFGFHLVQVLDRKYVSQNNKTIEMWAFSMPIPIQKSEILKVEKQTNDLLKTNTDFVSLNKAINTLGKEFREINQENFTEIASNSKGNLSAFPTVVKFENPSNNIVKFYIIAQKNLLTGRNLIDIVKEEFTFAIINKKKAVIFQKELEAYKNLNRLSKRYQTKVKKVIVYADGSTSEELNDIGFNMGILDVISLYKKGDVFPIDTFSGVYFFEK